MKRDSKEGRQPQRKTASIEASRKTIQLKTAGASMEDNFNKGSQGEHREEVEEER